jgi:hypothetical protein
VILWSILPPLALYLAESWFLGTHVVQRELAERMLGYIPRAFHERPGHSLWAAANIGDAGMAAPASVWELFDPSGFFSSAATWIGAAAGIGLLVCAIQLRLRRTEI